MHPGNNIPTTKKKGKKPIIHENWPKYLSMYRINTLIYIIMYKLHQNQLLQLGKGNNP